MEKPKNPVEIRMREAELTGFCNVTVRVKLFQRNSLGEERSRVPSTKKSDGHNWSDNCNGSPWIQAQRH